MKKGIITLTTELTEGGCNACGPVKSELFTLELAHKEIVLTGMTLSGLVMGIVQADGWQQEFIAEIIDEYFLFRKGEQQVKLVEDYNQVTYSTAKESLTSANTFPREADLFVAVNQILSDLFQLEPIEFSIAS